MPRLFVDKTIEINASRAKVWDVLTNPKHTDRWASEFSSGGPTFHIESDWSLGSPVLWKGEDGVTIVEGKVTALKANQLLRFTVADTRSPKFEFTEEDGITFELSTENGQTKLHILQGDFSVMPDGAVYCQRSAVIWDRILPIIKELAEL